MEIGKAFYLSFLNRWVSIEPNPRWQKGSRCVCILQMEAIRAFGAQTFASLKVRNYRLYFIGQGLSDIGTWMQIVGIGWLVLELTGSGVALGTLLAFRFAPMLVLGLFAGDIVDRFDKRNLLYATQGIFLLLSGLLGILVFSGTIETWMVFLVALLFGVADTVDRPTRQTFIHEIVGPENLRNAVGLGSARANLARAIGPLFAGALIAGVGIATCFFMNSLSYLFALVSLAYMRKAEIHHEQRETRKVDNLFSVLHYVAKTPLILTILVAMAIVGTLTYEFQTTLPLLSKVTFLGDASDYAALLSAFGVGSVVGGLFSASRKEVGMHEFVLWAFFFRRLNCRNLAHALTRVCSRQHGFLRFFFDMSFFDRKYADPARVSIAHARTGDESLDHGTLRLDRYRCPDCRPSRGVCLTACGSRTWWYCCARRGALCRTSAHCPGRNTPHSSIYLYSPRGGNDRKKHEIIALA